MDKFGQLIDQIWGKAWWAVPLSALLPLIFLTYSKVYNGLTDKDTGPATRLRLKEILVDKAWPQQYRLLLSKLQNALQHVFGDSHSWQALRVCWVIALWYTFLLLYISTIENDAVREARLIVGLSVVIASIPLGLLLNRAIKWFGARYTKLKFVRIARKQHIVVARVLESIGVLLCIPITIISFVFYGTTAIFIFMNLSSREFLSALVIAVVVSFVAVLLGSFVTALGLALLLLFFLALLLSTVVGPEGADAAVLFWGLPFVNALFDWASWNVSRHFINRARRPQHWQASFRDLAADAAIAMLIMATMSLVMTSLFDSAVSLERYLGWSDPFSWAHIAINARDDPWGAGLPVTLMLVTTLVPTLLHIACGTIALSLHFFLPGQTFVKEINRMNDRSSPTFGNAIDGHYLTIKLFCGAFAGLVPFGCWIALFFWAPNWVGTALYSLATKGAHPFWLVLLIPLTLVARKQFHLQEPHAPKPAHD